jgi:RNA polymerase sigma-70 factor, ECF subfamily
MEQHVPYVWRVLRSMGVAEHDLPDVCQDTFLVVHRRLAEFEGRSSLRTWICGIALRVASDHRGKAYRRREQAQGELPDVADSAAQDDELERRQAREQLGRLLDGLPADQRQVFVLFEIEQMQMKEVAAVVGCPLSTAYSRLYAARDTLKRALTAPDSKVAP